MLDILMLATEPVGTFEFLSWEYWQQGGDASRSEVFRNFMLVAVAVVALVAGTWRAWTSHLQAKAANEQARIAEQGLFTDRFSTAVEHLGNPDLSVRLGGIYALWRLARDSPEDMLRILDVLCAFVRHPPQKPDSQREPIVGGAEEALDEDASWLRLRPDVQAVLDLIADKEAVYRRHLPPDYRLNLRHAGLTHAELGKADLRNVDFTLANLTKASLAHADLTGACLAGANLTHAVLYGADLAKADLDFAILTGTGFVGAKNIPDLPTAFANSDYPPRGLPDDVKRPKHWFSAR